MSIKGNPTLRPDFRQGGAGTVQIPPGRETTGRGLPFPMLSRSTIKLYAREIAACALDTRTPEEIVREKLESQNPAQGERQQRPGGGRGIGE